MFRVQSSKFKVPVRLGYIVICGLICFFLVSCSFMSKFDPGFIQRSWNREHLKLLKKGMTQQEVSAIMGPPQIQRKFHKSNLWFYYTVWDWADAQITEIECTPVVFEHDRLIGKGLAFFRNYIHGDWLFNTNKIFSEENSGK
jgi:hypothetical protein